MPRAPILLLHGVLDSTAVWDRVASHLGEQHGLLREPAYDGPDPTPRGQAERALPLLPPGGAHVVGHSRGGAAACWLAVEHPELVLSLAVVASPPFPSEVFRAWSRRLAQGARPEQREALLMQAALTDDDFAQHALRRYQGRALVVEYEDDELYSPTQTMFWRMFLPYADFERVPGRHRALAESEEAALWLARRLRAHLEAAETLPGT